VNPNGENTQQQNYHYQHKNASGGKIRRNPEQKAEQRAGNRAGKAAGKGGKERKFPGKNVNYKNANKRKEFEQNLLKHVEKKKEELKQSLYADLEKNLVYKKKTPKPKTEEENMQ
jgi:hypothetical protein